MTDQGIQTQYLVIVAQRVHNALLAKGLTHTFLGGLEVVLLGCPGRSTKDVDVEVKTQFLSLNNLGTIKAAFADRDLFRIADGTRSDGFRMLCNGARNLATDDPYWIGVDVFSRSVDMVTRVAEPVTVH